MSPKPRLLIVEDQASELRAMTRLLTLEGYEVVAAREPDEAMAHVGEPVDLAISDLRMGAKSGIDLMRQWKAQRPDTPFVMVTAYAEVDSAVTAMKLGAKDYLAKPVNPVELLQLVSRLLQECAPQSGGAAAPDEPSNNVLIGESAAMREVFARIERAQRTDSAVLIIGESGTGKELTAEAIHRGSRRRQGPFVVFNANAASDELIESELFGQQAGAALRPGLSHQAEGGTLFIDEIGDCPPAAQAKLLRALEARKAAPAGSAKERPAVFRLIASSSRDLYALVKTGHFQQDLYYRLEALSIDLPPLRDRRTDIPLLLDYFLEESSAANGRPKAVLNAELRQFLLDFDWPGNVRQLRHTIESMVVMAKSGELTLADLPPHLVHGWSDAEATAATAEATTLENLEKAAVLQALERCHGNRTHAAGALGISIRTLQRKLKSWGMSNER